MLRLLLKQTAICPGWFLNKDVHCENVLQVRACLFSKDISSEGDEEAKWSGT